MRSKRSSAGLVLTALLLVGCGGSEEDAPTPAETAAEDEGHGESLATWEMGEPEAIDSNDESIEIGVSRLGCASGETGEIVDVDITPEDDQIVIQAYVEALTGEAYNCQDNEIVPIDIDFGEPIAGRALVDGACQHERAAGTRFCETSVRWSGEVDG